MGRLFTPTEANATLPLVRRIVVDILRVAAEIRALADRAHETEIGDRIAGLQHEIQEQFAELEQIGCSFRDWGFEMGLVDFPAEIDGQPVLLCWRSDEERITWYHTHDGGFAGRMPIPGEQHPGDREEISGRQ